MLREYQVVRLNLKIEESRLLDWARSVNLEHPDTALVFEHMSQDLVMGVLEQQRKLLFSFARLDEKYNIPAAVETSEALVLAHERLAESSTEGLKKKPFSLTKKLKDVQKRLAWVLTDKERMQGLIAELAIYNDRLNEALRQGQIDSLVAMQARSNYETIYLKQALQDQIVMSQETADLLRHRRLITELDGERSSAEGGPGTPRSRIKMADGLSQPQSVESKTDWPSDRTRSVDASYKAFIPDEAASLCDTELSLSEITPSNVSNMLRSEDGGFDVVTEIDGRTGAFYKNKMVWIEWKRGEPVTPGHDSLDFRAEERVKSLTALLKNRIDMDNDIDGPPCLQTLEGHSNAVDSVAFSHDSARLASASRDSTVKIWDAHSGACLQTLEGHSGSVHSVAFSHDSARLASASSDSTVKIWDAHSGALRIPPCFGYFKDLERARFGIVFGNPSPVASVEGPQTLHSLFGENNGIAPSLTVRIRIMTLLSETLQRVHAMGLLHRAIRPTNIIFFRNPGSSEVNLNDPYLSGFDPVRRSDPTFHPLENLYRHPDVQAPLHSDAFSPTHDLYALGIVLLELALWQPIEKILKLNPLKASPRQTRLVREWLLDEEPEWLLRVRSAAGDTVEEVIRGYLAGPPGLGLPGGVVDVTVTRQKLVSRSVIPPKKKLGADHPDTLNSMANLASTYGNQGRWDAAEELEVQVMETHKKKLGADHPDTLTSMNNLAQTYSNQGRWDDAKELQVQMMKTFKKKLGADHSSTLTSMANLASTYRNQGRWDAAEELGVQVMESCKKKLGANHPETLTSMANLASTYGNQGRWDAAEELEVQVMETHNKKLGADHPDTLTSMNNLAQTYSNQGRWDDAKELQVQVMENFKKKLGADHSSTLTSMANLASTYRNQGRWDAAEEVEVQVIETRKKKLGADHPDTLTSMNDLAFTLKARGQSAEAVVLMRQCVQQRQRVLNASHPDLKSSLAALEEWEAE
jgi:tetratricopeptide (TPR) repeat protein